MIFKKIRLRFTESDCSYGWIGDLYCSDENNKEEWEWDGSDCCPGSDPTYDWDYYYRLPMSE